MNGNQFLTNSLEHDSVFNGDAVETFTEVFKVGLREGWIKEKKLNLEHQIKRIYWGFFFF